MQTATHANPFVFVDANSNDIALMLPTSSLDGGCPLSGLTSSQISTADAIALRDQLIDALGDC